MEYLTDPKWWLSVVIGSLVFGVIASVIGAFLHGKISSWQTAMSEKRRADLEAAEGYEKIFIELCVKDPIVRSMAQREADECRDNVAYAKSRMFIGLLFIIIFGIAFVSSKEYHVNEAGFLLFSAILLLPAMATFAYVFKHTNKAEKLNNIITICDERSLTVSDVYGGKEAVLRYINNPLAAPKTDKKES